MHIATAQVKEKVDSVQLAKITIVAIRVTSKLCQLVGPEYRQPYGIFVRLFFFGFVIFCRPLHS